MQPRAREADEVSPLAHRAMLVKRQTARQGAGDHLGGAIEPVRSRHGLGEIGAVGGVRHEGAGPPEPAQQGHALPVPRQAPLRGHCQHLFGGVGQNLAAQRHEHAASSIHRQRVPGTAHAEAVDQSLVHEIDHERGRRHHQLHIPVRIEPARAQKSAQQVGMGGEEMHGGQREAVRPPRLSFAHEGREPMSRSHPVRQGIAADGGEILQQALRQGDSIAVEIEQKWRPQGTFRLSHAHARRQRQRGQHMGRVVMADHEAVA